MHYIKSVNSIGFCENPPDYYLLANVIENRHGWINYVYPDSCDNPELFDYLLTKNLWLETMDTVSKYIYERQNISVQDIRETSAGGAFNVVGDLDPQIFDQEISLKIYTGNGELDSIEVNGQGIEFTLFDMGDQSYVKFNLIPAKVVKPEISPVLQSLATRNRLLLTGC